MRERKRVCMEARRELTAHPARCSHTLSNRRSAFKGAKEGRTVNMEIKIRNDCLASGEVWQNRRRNEACDNPADNGQLHSCRQKRLRQRLCLTEPTGVRAWVGFGLGRDWLATSMGVGRLHGEGIARAKGAIPAQKGNHQHGERHAEGQPAHVIAPEAVHRATPLYAQPAPQVPRLVYPTFRYTFQRRETEWQLCVKCWNRAFF